MKARVWSEVYPGWFVRPKRVWMVQAAGAHGPIALDSFESCVRFLDLNKSNVAYEQMLTNSAYWYFSKGLQ
jgi:hypothetical protein